jgi:O-antigen/teichoic acid export membrane protein
MRLFKSVSISFASRIAEQALALITTVVVTRMLGPEGKGTFTFVLAILSIILQFGNLGLMSPIAYYAAQGEDYARRAGSISLFASLVWGSLLLLVSYGAIRTFPGLTRGADERLVLLALIAIPAALAQLYFLNAILGTERIVAFNMSQLLFEFLRLLGTLIVLFFFTKSLIALVISFVLTYYVVAVFEIYLFRRISLFSVRDFDFSLLRAMLSKAYRVYLSTLFAFLVLRSDVVLLNYFKGAYQVGIYSVGVAASDKLMLLPITIGMMLFPKVAGGSELSGALTARTLRFTSFLMALACLAGAILGYPAIILLFGKTFSPSYVPFLILLPGVYFMSLETILMYDFGGRGFPRIVYLSPLAGFAMNFLLNIFLVPRFGYKGAAFTSTLAYLLMMILNATYFSRVTGIRTRELFVPTRQELTEGLARVTSAIRRTGQQLLAPPQQID